MLSIVVNIIPDERLHEEMSSLHVYSHAHDSIIVQLYIHSEIVVFPISVFLKCSLVLCKNGRSRLDKNTSRKETKRKEKKREEK